MTVAGGCGAIVIGEPTVESRANWFSGVLSKLGRLCGFLHRAFLRRESSAMELAEIQIELLRLLHGSVLPAPQSTTQCEGPNVPFELSGVAASLRDCNLAGLPQRVCICVYICI